MELQFNKTAIPCLKQVAREVQNQEVTQEIRLSDALPDIGKVLGAWGQILIRSKEWRTGEMGLSGGVMVFVLYAPEDGSEPRSVESWLPFQMKWNIPDSQRDGTMLVSGLLRGVDARSTSARKLMVRCNVSVLGEGMEPAQVDVYSPGEVPEDVQLLRRNYPVKLPQEAGEKAFVVEEQLEMPASIPSVDKIIRYELLPELIDQKVMAGKVVFRGAAIVRVLYRTEDGTMGAKDFEIPFSQYTDLEREYDQESDARVTMAVTSLELDTGDDDTLLLKAGLVGQYVVFDRPVIEVVEDAYSPTRAVSPRMEEAALPMVLDDRVQTVHAQANIETGGNVLDMAFYPDHPRLRRGADTVEMELTGIFHVLSSDGAGVLQSGSGRWEESWSLPSDAESRIEGAVRLSGKPQCTAMGENASVRADLVVQAQTLGEAGLPMVTALELGEALQPDPNRPSLILRRAGEERLWDMAKQCGSTVDAIRKANHLTDEPASGQYLLIPVS